jgi:hypothetical protein
MHAFKIPQRGMPTSELFHSFLDCLFHQFEQNFAAVWALGVLHGSYVGTVAHFLQGEYELSQLGRERSISPPSFVNEPILLYTL